MKLVARLDPSTNAAHVTPLLTQLLSMVGIPFTIADPRGKPRAEPRTIQLDALGPDGYGVDTTLTMKVPERWSRAARVKVHWDRHIPCLYHQENGPPPRFIADGRLDVDVLGAMEFCIAGEELVTQHRDGIGRFRPEFSVLDELGLSFTPPIDRYVVEIRNWFQARAPHLVSASWRDGARFLVALTHDVDMLLDTRPSLGRIVHAARRGVAQRRGVALQTAVTELARFATRRARAQPVFNFDEWVKLEERHGVRSTYHFMGDYGPGRDSEDPWYQYGDRGLFRGTARRLRDVMRALSEDGFDVGLHASIGSFRDRAALARDTASLEAAIGHTPVSVRAHHLRFDLTAAEAFAAQGFAVDSSVGGMGFARGIGYPHPSYVGTAAAGLIELPTVAMDHIFFKEARQGLPSEVIERRLQRLLEEVRASGGAVALLFHTDVVDGERKHGIYERLLTWIEGNGGRSTTASDVAAQWQARTARLR